MQMIPRARHRDVKEPALLLDFGAAPGREIGWKTSVDRVQDVDRLPLLSFRRMDGREDQIVLVEKRIAGTIAGGVRRIERQLGQEPLAAWISRGDLHKLQKIGLAQQCIVVDALQVRFIPAPSKIEFRRPTRRFAANQTNSLDKSRP